jgi:hypothetical protein
MGEMIMKETENFERKLAIELWDAFWITCCLQTWTI